MSSYLRSLVLFLIRWVGRLVYRSVCHNYHNGRKVTLQCSSEQLFILQNSRKIYSSFFQKFTIFRNFFQQYSKTLNRFSQLRCEMSPSRQTTFNCWNSSKGCVGARSAMGALVLLLVKILTNKFKYMNKNMKVFHEEKGCLAKKFYKTYG